MYTHHTSCYLALLIKAIHITWQQASHYPKATNIQGINQSCSSSKHCIFTCSSKHHCERLGENSHLVISKKRFWYLLGHLSFWVSDVESPFIFYTKKKKKLNKTLHGWIVSFHWLNKRKYIFENKTENYMALGPSYKLCKDKTKVYLSKDTRFGG